MTNVLSRRGVLAAALATLVATGVPVRAKDKPADTLTLKSAYSREVFVDWARQVHLTVTLDGKGGGSGTLTLDPNIHDEWGSTCIAIKDTQVQLRLVQDDHHAAKGRRLYELREVGLEGKVAETGPAQWLLVVPTKAGTPCSLLFLDKDGKTQDVVMME